MPMNWRVAAGAPAGLAALGVILAALRAPGSPSALSVWDGVYTAAQAERGQPVYIEHCSFCHGETLEGDDESTPLSGDEFKSNWDGLALGRLFDRIRKDMPLNRPGTLSRKQSADILAYILSVNEFPAGSVELASSPDVLNAIQFRAAKPDGKP